MINDIYRYTWTIINIAYSHTNFVKNSSGVINLSELLATPDVISTAPRCYLHGSRLLSNRIMINVICLI